MKTNGQLAYEVFHSRLGLEVGDEDWDVRQDDYREAWESAASAVLVAAEVDQFPRPLPRALTIHDHDEHEVAA